MNPDEAPDRYALPEEEDARQRFRILNDDMATWAMRKLRGILLKKAENKAIADAEIARIAEWLTTVDKSLQGDEDYFRAILVEYAVGQRAEGRKTLNLPYGKVTSRQGSGKWTVDKEMDFLEWAKANRPELVKVKESPAIAELKTYLTKTEGGYIVDTATGEVVPGVQVSDPEISFTVDVPID